MEIIFKRGHGEHRIPVKFIEGMSLAISEEYQSQPTDSFKEVRNFRQFWQLQLQDKGRKCSSCGEKMVFDSW